MDASGQHARIGATELVRPVLRVLVVDDDESVGVAIQAILSRRNYRTELASGAYAGIQALAASRFDVVLVDLFMTGMSGIDAIAHMRQQFDISIIAMSGFRLRSSLDPIDYFGAAMQRGASMCIRKPFSPRQLIEAIDFERRRVAFGEGGAAMMLINGSAGLNDRDGTEVSRIDRESVANEVGAAIAHQLNGPLTALLLYLGDLYQGSDQFPVADCNGLSLKEVAENALREAERVCAMMRRLGDSFEAPLREQTAFAQGREMIRWWSQAGNADNDTANTQEVSPHQIALTMREFEVLRLIREGCSNKEGGVRLQISHRTFESHRARLMRKYGAKNVADLLRLAARDQEGCDRSGSAVRGRTARPRRSGGSTRCER